MTDALHGVWRRARGPFHVVTCVQHRWEQYDVDRAGCLCCGLRHACSDNVHTTVCPLETLDDGTVGCLVTGMCMRCIRYCDKEYVEHAYPLLPTVVSQHSLDQTVYSVVYSFLHGAKTVHAREALVRRQVAAVNAAVARHMRQAKMLCEWRRPCLVDAIAWALHSVKPVACAPPGANVVQRCVDVIALRLAELGHGVLAASLPRLVVGMLYLMKQGLCFRGSTWLPRVEGLCACLPCESQLPRIMSMSPKLVCETENEIKMALRSRAHAL